MQLRLPLRDGLPHGEDPLELPTRRRIYVNRSLRFDLVSMVGFDMDYTLAIYRQEAMDRLSIEATAQKLVELGYPERVRDMRYRIDFPIRGLLIDRKLGNVLKMDRYRYVKKAYHGMRELTREERQQHYHRRPIKVASARYHFVDTLYALSEVAVFAAAIDALEAEGQELDFGALFDDIRRSIDLAHRDGSILSRITSEPSRYLVRDPELAPTLHKLRSAGKKLFVLTNSQAEYTAQVMSHLLDGAMREYPSWHAYFDIVVTGACKPAFFTETERSFEPAEPGLAPPNGSFERGRMYRGGCMAKFREHADVEGDQVLYVGDHIYGDVLRAKKETAWRTAMIVQEMDHEIRVHAAMNGRFERADELDGISDVLYEELRVRQREARELGRRLDDARAQGGPSSELEAMRVQHRRAIDRLKSRLRDIEHELNDLEEHIEQAFHPFWGSLFKAGPEVSIFGDQVEQYACLYTDRVSNFLHYSPLHYFRSPRDRMPHERF